MNTETKWIDWKPKVGDVRPAVYRYFHKPNPTQGWIEDSERGRITQYNIDHNDYQIPAPKETAMKYWQPRREPVAKGWTLADVPDGVLCEAENASHGVFFATRDASGSVFKDKTFISRTPSSCRVIRVIDPIPAGAMTLDKVPENVKCACTGIDDKYQVVRYRIGNRVFDSEGTLTGHSVDSLTVLHILDPLPEVTVTLDTLPVGRVIEQDKWHWFVRC